MFSSNATQVSSDAAFIEDVFSTWLYTGNGSTQTINNGIDLTGKGGLVWLKSRSNAFWHSLWDTSRGALRSLASNVMDQSYVELTGVDSFLSNGFSLNQANGSGGNGNGVTYVAWTFREQSKFFDIVTYTGNGANRTIAHSLGSVPGCIIVKRLDTSGDWQVYHRSLANTQYMVLNSAAAVATGATRWNSATPTATDFSLGTDATVNANGGTYIAYLFAHDAGGFGATGADNVISCGSFTTDGSGNMSVSLGYEPQWLLFKSSSTLGDWFLYDNMRGFGVTSGSNATLYPNLSDSESLGGPVFPNATGFSGGPGWGANRTYIYIAIRRGPMRTPTSGTSVFAPQVNTGTGTAKTQTVGFPVDLVIAGNRSGMEGWTQDRLRDFTNNSARLLHTVYNLAESTVTTANRGVMLDGTVTGQVQYTTGNSNLNQNLFSFANWFFRRAPGFFDVVCYTGNSTWSARPHNLGAVPELILSKSRSTSADWNVWQPSSTFVGALNNNTAFFNNGPSPATATTFTPVSDNSGVTFVAYLFASCPGVSRVGSFTGTGSTQVINCGFAAGARFVLIKRTDSTGDWYVWDSARGIVAGNDPYLHLNGPTAAEVTNTDWVNTAASGFELSNAGGNLVNTNGGSYIFLAIA